MSKTDVLIRTKLHPPFIRAALTPRPRLEARIADGLRMPLTLITAPAGFGKTTLVAAGTAHAGMAVAWLSLDKHDNQAGRFLRYLVAAFQTVDPALGSEALQLLASQAAPEAILTSLINALAAYGELALVLDDYQFIHSQVVYEQVTFLLEHAPSSLHLVIATRSDPSLPLARLRARGQIIELRTADLGFNVSEAGQFLNEVMGLRLDAAAVAALTERTEGWAAGLQLAALSLQKQQDVVGFIREFAGTHRFIMDFMMEEVLACEPEAVQAFLLQTAILSRLSGSLCDAVTGGAGGQTMLESLERRNLFVISLDDERHWYRYHQLFADLLQARLRQATPEQIPQLLTRAAAWCEGEGQIAEAVDYALAAEDYPRAAGLIARNWHYTANTGEIETVWGWLQALPEAVIKNSAPLGLAQCWLLWLMGQGNAIAAPLADAENALREFGVTADGSADLPAHLMVLRSVVARQQHDFESAVAFAGRALDLIPANQSPERDTQLRSIATFALAVAYEGLGDFERAVAAYTETIAWSRLAFSATGLSITYRLGGALRLLGRLRAAEAACRDALAYLQAQGMERLPAAGILHVALSEVLVERNELVAAEAHLSQGFALGKWSGRLDAAKNAVYALARLRLARRDVPGALAAIREAEAALGEPAPPLALAELLAFKARVLLHQGALREATEAAEEAVRLAGCDRGQTGVLAALAALRVRVAQGEAAAGVAELRRALAAAESSGRQGVVLELSMLRGLLLARQGEFAAAYADLERALALAEPEGYVRLFLEEGQPLQQFLGQWLSRAPDGAARDYARLLLSQFELAPQAPESEPAQTASMGDWVEPLSARELEVLQLMAQGKTNKEIARQLFVAPGTVKAHSASIYRKLDVANRTAAVARARQLDILP